MQKFATAFVVAVSLCSITSASAERSDRDTYRRNDGGTGSRAPQQACLGQFADPTHKTCAATAMGDKADTQRPAWRGLN